MTERDIDGLLLIDTELMRCDHWGSAMSFAANRCRGLLSLCISDTAKQMLLNNSGFIPHLLDGKNYVLSSFGLDAVCQL